MPKISTIRHSLAHILAAAIQEFYPGVKFGTGPAIENGFYYDFDFSKTNRSKQLTIEELPKIEKRMKEMVKQNLKFKKEIISKAKARKIFQNQPYKLELIKKIPEKNVFIYQCGQFVDLCQGPHIKSTKQIDPESFKLVKIAGAYWQGDEKNPMLIRIYGLAFSTPTELKNYLAFQEEAKKREHTKLGQKLELFTINEKVGSGLPLWLPKGARLKYIIEKFIFEKYLHSGYVPVSTPHIGSEELFTISGHLQHYQESMYAPIKIDQEKYYLKPMNCPFHLIIYQTSPKSYRDLPIRYTELGTVYRYEKSGTLRGLTRVRGFTQDDGHIICRPDQLEDEIKKALKLTLQILKTFGFKKFKTALSVRDQRNKKGYLGKNQDWQKAEKALTKALEAVDLDYIREKGEAAFYGPKIDIKVKDALGREWQISTLQLDFNLPERFDINYINQKGQKERPFMIHRALLGSIERFIGLLIENYAGDFPFWLAPIQVWIIPISEKQNRYADQVAQKLEKEDIRFEIKNENETLGRKIREGETQKIPYLLIVGQKESDCQTVTVRKRKKGNLETMKIEKFIQKTKAKTLS